MLTIYDSEDCFNILCKQKYITFLLKLNSRQKYTPNNNNNNNDNKNFNTVLKTIIFKKTFKNHRNLVIFSDLYVLYFYL